MIGVLGSWLLILWLITLVAVVVWSVYAIAKEEQ